MTSTSEDSRKMAVTLVKTLAQYGFEPGAFDKNGIPDVTLGLIANHYPLIETVLSQLELI